MGFIDGAAYWSKINGFDYYKNGNVINVVKVNDCEYHAKVKGSGNNIYDVVFIPDHPRKTTCTCPRAFGKSSICKHKIAVYYALNPSEADKIQKQREIEELEQQKLEKEFMLRHKKRVKEATKYVESLSFEEMKRILIDYKVSEAEEYEEQFYEDSYDDEYYWR